MRTTTRPGATRAGRTACRHALAVALCLAGAATTPHGVAAAGGAPDRGPDCPAGRVALGAACVPADEAAEGVRGVIREAIARDGLKAVIVSVRIGETPVLTEAWGESMTGVPATPEMHFRNGAVAIAYLATVLLQLADEGAISLDDPLSTWFPEYPASDRITMRMLVNTTSGYADYVDLDILPLYQDVFRQWTPDELVALALAQPMACAPGACFAYAHTNFVILGEVLRKVTGRPVEELIRERILAPLGLDDTRSESTAAIQAPVLHAFTDERGVYEDSTYWNPSWTTARGAVMTTDIGDLLASAVAIGSGALVSPEAHAQQIAAPAPLMPPFTETIHYGLGVLVTNGWVIQTPSFAGYSAAMAYLPSRKIAIAVSATLRPDPPTDVRPTDTLFSAIGAYLAPGQPPALTSR